MKTTKIIRDKKEVMKKLNAWNSLRCTKVHAQRKSYWKCSWKSLKKKNQAKFR